MSVQVPWGRADGVGPYGVVLRPIVPVFLRSPATGKAIGVNAVLDSGADFTHGATRLLQMLGVELKDCEGEVTAFNSTRTITFRAPIELEIADTYTVRFDAMQFRDWGALSASEHPGILLGTNDVLRFIRATLDYGVTTLEPREPGATSWAFPHELLEPAAA